MSEALTLMCHQILPSLPFLAQSGLDTDTAMLEHLRCTWCAFLEKELTGECYTWCAFQGEKNTRRLVLYLDCLSGEGTDRYNSWRGFGEGGWEGGGGGGGLTGEHGCRCMWISQNITIQVS